ncbi:uncharacterized protein LOC144564120 isoform X2 [Carex rostrata]
MGCNMSSEPNVDDEEALSRTVAAPATPPRSGLQGQRVHDVNRRSVTLQDGSHFAAKGKDRFPGSPQGKGPALLNRVGSTEESIGSPSFRCYVKNGMQPDGIDIVTAICEQKKANRKFSNSPLRNETPSPLHSIQETELKSQKKEKGWMSKVLSKRDGDSGNTVPPCQ